MLPAPIFAQISEKATDPIAWSELAKTIGPGGLFAVILLLVVGLLGYLLYRATVGPNGFLRAIAEDLHARGVATLTHLTDSIDRLEIAAKSDSQAEEDLRACGREFARGMSAIADAVKADVTTEAAVIASTLTRKT
jgi:hypothetical protein